MDIKTKVNNVKEYAIRHKKTFLIGTGTFIGGVLIGSKVDKYSKFSKLFGYDMSRLTNMLNYVSDSKVSTGYAAYGNNEFALKDLGKLGTSVMNSVANVDGETDVRGVLMFMK